MARFILDVMLNPNNEKGQKLISKILGVIEESEDLAREVCSIVCIDETNENQFYRNDEGTTTLMNEISEKQFQNHKTFLKKC